LEEGVVEYMGRGDQQIKRHGVRIELGEIEGVLREVEGVREAVVVQREGGLVGYVQGEEGCVCDLVAVREEVRRRLPEVMVPGRLVECERWPLSRNGKLDRRALAEQDLAALAQAGPQAEPETPGEQLIARIWCDVLQVREPGIDENFFDLGGHSLRLMVVQHNLEQAFGASIPIVDLFQYTTIRSLARYLAERQPESPRLVRAERRVEQQQASRQRQRELRRRPAGRGAQKGARDE
jgi:acyl carrier protein